MSLEKTWRIRLYVAIRPAPWMCDTLSISDTLVYLFLKQWWSHTHLSVAAEYQLAFQMKYFSGWPVSYLLKC